MKKLKYLKYQISINFQNNIKGIKLDGLGITIILMLVVVLLAINIIRVINKGRENYKVYLYERNQLEDLRDTNVELSYELEFVSSEDAQKLLARDILGVAENGETLYRTKDSTQYFEVKPDLLEVEQKTNYQDWWKLLLK